MAAGEAWHNVEVGQVLALSNNAEGDCLFEALSMQLDGAMSSRQLREIAVTYLSDHRQDLEAELFSLGWEMIDSGEIPIPLDGDILIDAVIQTLSDPRSWAGAECLAAISLALNRPIRVFQEDGPTINFPGDGGLLRVLLRFPRFGNRRTHYESVLHWRPGPKPDNCLPNSSEVQPEQRDASTQSESEGTSSVPEVSLVILVGAFLFPQWILQKGAF